MIIISSELLVSVTTMLTLDVVIATDDDFADITVAVVEGVVEGAISTG